MHRNQLEVTERLTENGLQSERQAPFDTVRGDDDAEAGHSFLSGARDVSAGGWGLVAQFPRPHKGRRPFSGARGTARATTRGPRWGSKGRSPWMGAPPARTKPRVG